MSVKIPISGVCCEFCFPEQKTIATKYIYYQTEKDMPTNTAYACDKHAKRVEKQAIPRSFSARDL